MGGGAKSAGYWAGGEAGSAGVPPASSDASEITENALAAAGVPARATRYAGVPHAFLYTPPSLSRKADSALD